MPSGNDEDSAMVEQDTAQQQQAKDYFWRYILCLLLGFAMCGSTFVYLLKHLPVPLWTQEEGLELMYGDGP